MAKDYRYDGLGRWVQTLSGGTTDYVYDSDHIILEKPSAGVSTRYNYNPGTDQLHSLNRGSSTYYYVTDNAGTVQGLLDTNFNVVTKFKPWVFGKRHVVNETVVQPFGFQGRPLDRETGLYNFRARWYDPGSERFISEDPIGLEGGINPFVFANNDPVNGRDPSGMDCLKDKNGNLIYCAIEGITVTALRGGGGHGLTGLDLDGSVFLTTENGHVLAEMPRWYDFSVSDFLFGGSDTCGNSGSDPNNCIVAAAVPDIFSPRGAAIKISRVAPAVRSVAVRNAYLKSIADKLPRWMQAWISKGRVPPGYQVDHIRPLSVGGRDVIENLRLRLTADHVRRHRFYHPWRP